MPENHGAEKFGKFLSWTGAAPLAELAGPRRQGVHFTSERRPAADKALTDITWPVRFVR